jgi:transposase InsO family protein
VPKHDGGVRMCINYHPLNAILFLDAYPLPRIDDMLRRVAGHKFYSTFDLASGYWQIPLREQDKCKTAFYAPSGFYEFNVMPFGIATGPGTFQRLVDDMLQGMLHVNAEGYIDDIIIFSDTLDQHVIDVRQLFVRLQEYGLSLKRNKCRLWARTPRYVGHVVSEAGVSPDPNKIAAIKEYPTPTCPEDVRAFVGFAGYYRSHIHRFAHIAAPLYVLLKKDTPWRWTDVEERGFQQLKDSLMSHPVLVKVMPDVPFMIDTDASFQGIAAILSQDHGVIEFASRSLNAAEKRYFPTELEYLALVWALQRFHVYVHGHKFTARVDHEAIVKIHNRPKPEKYTGANGRIERWIIEVSRYQPWMTVVQRKGKLHINVDVLSRYPRKTTDPSLEDTMPENGLVMMVQTRQDTSRLPTLDDVIDSDSDDSQDEYEAAPPITNLDAPHISGTEPNNAFPGKHVMDWNDIDDPLQMWKRLVQATAEDETLSAISEYITNNSPPEDEKLAKYVRSEACVCELREGLLLRHTPSGIRVMVPAAMRQEVVTLMHATPIGGHLGITKTQHRVSDRFIWPRMWEDIAQIVAVCPTCQLNKRARPTQVGFLRSLPITLRPMTTIGMDIVVFRRYKTIRGYLAVLVITEYCTRFVDTYPLTSESAEEIATCVLSYICRHGAPKNILSDRGKQFLGNVFKVITTVFNIHKVNTSPYHPQTDGLTERFNQTMEQMLRSYASDFPLDWDLWLPLVKFAYNTSYHESIKMSPYEALYGFKAAYPYEAILTTVLPEYVLQDWNSTQHDRMGEIKRRLAALWYTANQNLSIAQQNQAKHYNEGRSEVVYAVGDKVLLNVSKTNLKRSYRKLRYDWHGPYKVVEVKSEVLYQIEPCADGVNSQLVASPIHISRLKSFKELPEKFREGDQEVNAYDEDFYVEVNQE